MMTTPNPPISFGRWLRQLRNQQNLTQEMLAEVADCSVQAIRFFESGKRRPSLGMAEHLADLLQIPAADRAEFLRLARLTVEVADSTDEELAGKAHKQATPPSTASMIRKSLLPPLDHTLIGRESERNILRQLLIHDQRRLVTMMGAGGMGKTYLALEIATKLASHFADGAAFVSLTTLRSVNQLPGAVAEALQISLGSGDPSEQVLTLLAPRHLLLVLDGFESLLNREEGAAVTWVNLLLQRAPQVQVLVTSRERLRLSGERIFELGGLSLPNRTTAPEASEAVLLFLERAQQAAGHFRLDAQNQAAIMHICQLVDGMPLGIELAAAWVRVLTPAEIAEELAKNVDFLARANRDTPARHRSMRAIFDHSWELLNEEERSVLMRMAVFRGGCQREAAEAVAGAPLRLLAGLIDKSLVRRTQTAGHARYDLHEVVRQFAGEKRREQNEHAPTQPDEVRLRHYTYFYELTMTAKQRLQGSEQIQSLRVLDEEHANLRAALDHCLAIRDAARGLRLAIQLEDYWYMRGHHREGLQTILNFATLPTVSQPLPELAAAYAAAGLFAIAGGNYDEARLYLERSVKDARASNDRATLGRALRYLGIVYLHEEDLTAAQQEFEEAAAINEQIGNRAEWAITLSHLAEIALLQQKYGQAQQVGEQAVQLLRTTQNKNQLAGSLRRLAQAHSHQAQVAPALRYALESLDLNCEVGDRRGIAASIVVLSTLLAPQAQWSSIAQLLDAADALLTQANASLLPADQVEYDQIQSLCRKELGDQFIVAQERGRTQLEQSKEALCDFRWIKQLFP